MFVRVCVRAHKQVCSYVRACVNERMCARCVPRQTLALTPEGSTCTLCARTSALPGPGVSSSGVRLLRSELPNTAIGDLGSSIRVAALPAAYSAGDTVSGVPIVPNMRFVSPSRVALPMRGAAARRSFDRTSDDEPMPPMTACSKQHTPRGIAVPVHHTHHQGGFIHADRGRGYELGGERKSKQPKPTNASNRDSETGTTLNGPLSPRPVTNTSS